MRTTEKEGRATFVKPGLLQSEKYCQDKSQGEARISVYHLIHVFVKMGFIVFYAWCSCAGATGTISFVPYSTDRAQTAKMSTPPNQFFWSDKLCGKLMKKITSQIFDSQFPLEWQPTSSSRCMSHNPLHPWFRGDKRQGGGWGDPKGLEGGGGGPPGGSAGGTAPFTFPPTPPTDGAPEVASGHEYNMAVFLHPDPSGIGQDMKPILSSQQKQREGTHGYYNQDYNHFNSYHQLMFPEKQQPKEQSQASTSQNRAKSRTSAGKGFSGTGRRRSIRK
ncbi:unnamed protein product [Nesidiocoris tenuis]|uniref:Uncharacterized protein n=1 Tax=Nesidiocoris tenuis TaxID=355587 RepID=A0A6H5GDT3_9HEMI|nr:unnamed protein product [Nesidiocoris tenuis]